VGLLPLVEEDPVTDRAGLLRNRSFRLLWSGHVVSSFGDALTSLALLLIAQRLTGSTTAVAATAIAIALPQLLVGLPAGVLVDRWNPRRVMIASDLARAVLVLGFIAVVTADRMWLLYTLAFVQSSVGTFFNPARAALMPELVPPERLLPANSLLEMSRVVAGVAGAATAGALASTRSDLSIVFVADAVTFLASAALIARIAGRAPTRIQAARGHVLSELGSGLRLILGSRILVGVVVAGAVAMLGLGAVNVLLVPFVVEDLGASEAWFGALEAAQVTAMVIAGSLLALFAARTRATHLISAGAIGLGASVAAMAVCDQAWQLMILLFAAGWFVTPVQASVTTILQTAVPAGLRGRAQATFAALTSAASLVSMAVAGLAAGAAGIRSVFVVAGFIVVAAGVASAAAFRGTQSLRPALGTR
jgi:MFS transporter, DHA3 family, macrolide efflux protein